MTPRRDFLRILGAGVGALALPSGLVGASGKPLRGIFPIAQTPFTNSDQLDLDTLVAELKFLDRGRVHGFVWPQLASEWTTLTEKERMEGTEAILSASKKTKPAIVIGVQAPEVATAITYAKHAQKLGADAIIALPPSEGANAKVMTEYYSTIAKACDLPMFVQAVGSTMTVDFIVELYRALPTMRFIKDEAGDPLDRVGPLRAGSNDQLKMFSGAHGRTMIEELRRGFSGSMPAASFADLYAQTFDLWQAGKKREAMDMHARTLLLLTEMNTAGGEGMKYILHLRGVFPTWHNRRTTRVQGFSAAAAVASGGRGGAINEESKRALKDMLAYLKPYLRA